MALGGRLPGFRCLKIAFAFLACWDMIIIGWRGRDGHSKNSITIPKTFLARYVRNAEKSFTQMKLPNGWKGWYLRLNG